MTGRLLNRFKIGCRCINPFTLADMPGLILLFIVGIGMTIWSWLCWPDPIVDFGRELYTPWQLTQGKVLYRDMVLFNGPLSQYFNAVLFACFGASLLTLVYANLLILAATVSLMFVMIRDVASRFAATLGCMTFLLIFVFNQYTRIGNFNWITPYSHELTHGIALSVMSLYFAKRWLASPHRIVALLTGLVTGLVFLTKVEVYVACIGSLTLAWLIPLLFKHRDVRSWMVDTILFALGMLIPPVTAWVLLSLAMPMSDALKGTMGSWAYVLDSEHAALPFFHWSIGGVSFSEQLIATGWMLGWYVLMIAPIVMIGLAVRRGWMWRIGAFLLCFVALMTVIVVQGESLLTEPMLWLKSARNWSDFALPWPMLLLLLAGVLFFKTWQTRKDKASFIRWACSCVLVSFAFLLTLKMLMNVRTWQYGFALAMPAGVVMTVMLFEGLPRHFARLRVNPWLLRGWGFVLWSLVLIFHLNVASAFVRHKQVQVGSGLDHLYALGHGRQINDAVAFLKTNARPGETLTVMPDGEIISYLTRMENPTPFGNYIPATLALFGEAQMLEKLKLNPPTWIALPHRNTLEYGASLFGKDYALTIWDWIEANYLPVYCTGAQPFNEQNAFGILIVQKRGMVESKTDVESE